MLVATSHSLTVLSPAPEASIVPSGENATERTGLLYSSRVKDRVTSICVVSEGPLYPAKASAPTVKMRVASVSKSVPSNSSSTVISVLLTRSTPKVTPSIPDTATASLISESACSYVPPLRVRVTTLSCSVASVNGEAVEATTDLVAETGICAVSAGPLYLAMASAPTVKVRVASVSMLPSNSSSTVISVSLTRSTSKVLIVTPGMPDTASAPLILKPACS